MRAKPTDGPSRIPGSLSETLNPTFRKGILIATNNRAVASGVTVDVSVQSGSRPVTNLRIEDFELRDSGVPQVIAGVTYGKLPIDITVALDISYSVRGSMLEPTSAMVPL